MTLGQIIGLRKHCGRLAVPAHIAQIPESAARQHLSVCLKGISEIFAVHAYLHRACIQKCFVVRDLHLRLNQLFMLFILREMIVVSLIMPCPHGNRPGSACLEFDRNRRHI